MKQGGIPYGNSNWNHKEDEFNTVDFLDVHQLLKNQLTEFRKKGISMADMIQAWEKCRIKQISFTNWLPGGKYAEIDDNSNGSDMEYFIEIEKKDPEEIKTAVKQLSQRYPEARGIKINPSEFYRVLFFYQVAHAVSRSGRFLFEFLRIKATEKFWDPGERYRFERKAWLWAVKMARRKHPRIKILYLSADEKKKLKFRRYMLEQDKKYRKELAKKEKAEAMKKAA
jgi:hypothetical protein